MVALLVAVCLGLLIGFAIRTNGVRGFATPPGTRWLVVTWGLAILLLDYTGIALETAYARHLAALREIVGDRSL